MSRKSLPKTRQTFDTRTQANLTYAELSLLKRATAWRVGK